MFARLFIPLLALIIATPALIVLMAWALPSGALWQHFADNLLLELLSNTLVLLLGVALGVAVLGTTLAWLVVMVEFPGRKYLEWALLLPFAIPAYVLAFVYLGIFDYAGVVQTFLRSNLGIVGFDIREGYLPIIAVFTLVFYPYVYLICRASFKRQQANLFASARLLGAGPWRVFWRMSLPLAYPAISAGVLVTLMETLADFGVVSLFNYNTFPLAIYSAWNDFRAIEVAAQLASILVMIAIVLIYLEYLGRKHIKYHSTEVIAHRPYRLCGYQGYLVSGFILGIVMLSFGLPIVQLVLWIMSTPDNLLGVWAYIGPLINTLTLALLASVIIIIIANILVLNSYHSRFNLQTMSIKLATLGYAIPGSVLAVGLLYGVQLLSNISQKLWGISLTQYLFGSLILLLFAYTTRFIAVAYQSIYAANMQLRPNLVDSAKLLGAKPLTIAFKVQLPLMKPGIIAASLLVIIDVIKELPATYLLRPFGFDTLAVRVYEFSSEAFYGQAAIPALIMVVLTSLLVLIFQRFDKRLTLN